jgi:hypothetical protein
MKKLIKKIKRIYWNWLVQQTSKIPITEKLVTYRSTFINIYTDIAIFDLQIETKMVNVKKGKRKYTLFIAKDKENKTVFNIGRHKDYTPYKILEN